jgi:hypothetical protein
VKVAILLAALTVLPVLPAPCAVDLSVRGIARTVSLSAASLSFGYVTVGTTSVARTLTVKNVGNAALTIMSVVITGTNASDFAQRNNCGSSVAPGANCTMSLTMTPTAAGMRRASLTISDNGATGSQTVSLAGMGIVPVISLSPASLFFASRSTGTTSAAQAIAVRNVGPGTLIITKLAITGADAGDYAQTNNCGNSVATQMSCTISVTFTPMASGSRTAWLSITDNASGGTQTVGLFGTATGSASGPSGTGTPPTGVSLSPASLSFASQPVATTSTAQTITLSNGNSAPLSITGLAITGTNPGDFAEIADTCGSSVAAGSTCTIGVTFTPSDAGQRTATLSVTDNAGSSPQATNFTGTGIPDIILSWSASPTPGVVGYNVYRGTASRGESSTPLNSSPISATTYVDSNVTVGTKYYYVLTSVGAGGVQSARSNETEAVVPTS